MLRILPLLLGLIAVTGVTVYLDDQPPDPRPEAAAVAQAASDRARREAVLETKVTFTATDEPVGVLLDRIALEHRLPIQRQGNSGDWDRRISLQIRQPQRLSSVLALCNLRAEGVEDGHVGIVPHYLAEAQMLTIFPAWHPADTQTSVWPRYFDLDYLVPATSQLLVLIGKGSEISTVLETAQRVQQTLDHELTEPSVIGPSAGDLRSLAAIEERLQRVVRVEWGRPEQFLNHLCDQVQVNCALQGISLESSRLCAGSPGEESAAQLLDQFCAERNIAWSVQQDRVVVHPQQSGWGASRRVVYPVGTTIRSQKAWLNLGLFLDPQQPGPWKPILGSVYVSPPGERTPHPIEALWLPAHDHCQSGALVVQTAEAMQHRVAKLVSTLNHDKRGDCGSRDASVQVARPMLPRCVFRDYTPVGADMGEMATLFRVDEMVGPMPKTLVQQVGKVAEITVTMICEQCSGFKGSPPETFLSRRKAGRCRDADILGLFLMTALAETLAEIHPYADFQTTPDGLLLTSGHQLGEMAAIWHADGPVSATWRRWLAAKPAERPRALAPALAGDDPLAAALAVCLLEPTNLQPAKQGILTCLARGTIHRGRGCTFAPYLWEAVLALEVSPDEIAAALTGLLENCPVPRPPAVTSTLEWAIYHPASEVQTVALLALESGRKPEEKPQIHLATLLHVAATPKSAAAVRGVVASYIEYWRTHCGDDEFRDNLLVVAGVYPAAFDILKEWALHEECRGAMGPVAPEMGPWEFCCELLRDSDPERRRSAILWLWRMTKFPQPLARAALEPLLGDPETSDVAKSVLDDWDEQIRQRAAAPRAK